MMGVYIKNMKLPGACLACDFCNPFAEEPYCRQLMKITPKTTTLPDCPLIKIPPHGRLIDADALIAAHEQVCSRSMKFNLDLAPTIIEAEEDECYRQKDHRPVIYPNTSPQRWERQTI